MSEKIDYTARRFLIADDELFMLGLLEQMLRQLKVGAIFKASDGAEALKMIKDEFSRVDCIIADFNMKPVNGLQLLQAVRMGVNARIPRDLPFIMLTGHGATEVVKSAITLDVNGYLVKPVAHNKLVQTLDRIFHKPIEIKPVEFYQSLGAGNTTVLNDADLKNRPPWVVVPKPGPLRDGGEDKASGSRVENLAPDGADAEIKMRNRRECDLADLQEGMFLAEDVEAEEGTILLRRGTSLTARMITRLKELAVGTQLKNYVWIGDPV